MANTPPTPPASSSLFDTLKNDLRVVIDDISQRGVSRSVGGTLSNLEAFYLTEDDRRRLLTMTPVRRWIRRIWWFTKGLLLKLTPARRLMLAAALVSVLLGAQRIDVGPRTQNIRIAIRFSTFGGMLLFAVLVLELKDKLVARDELEAGRKVQLALMPTESPRVPGWDIWLYTQPANDVGGDLVDHLQMDADRHVIALGDVAGKALPAALLSVKLQATLRALAPQFDDLAGLGDSVNRIFCRDGLPSRFASLVYLVVTANSDRVRVLNAGHMPPFVVRGGVATPMERGSVVLGIMPEAVFPEQSLELQPGDAMIVYSDGVSEAMNEAGDFFTDERIQSLAAQTSALSARQGGERILADVAAFIRDEKPNDDVSLMVLKRL